MLRWKYSASEMVLLLMMFGCWTSTFDVMHDGCGERWNIRAFHLRKVVSERVNQMRGSMLHCSLYHCWSKEMFLRTIGGMFWGTSCCSPSESSVGWKYSIDRSTCGSTTIRSWMVKIQKLTKAPRIGESSSRQRTLSRTCWSASVGLEESGKVAMVDDNGRISWDELNSKGKVMMINVTVVATRWMEPQRCRDQRKSCVVTRQLTSPINTVSSTELGIPARPYGWTMSCYSPVKADLYEERSDSNEV